MSIDSYKDQVGGDHYLAAICDITLSAVSRWRKYGMPRRYAELVQLYTGELSVEQWRHAVKHRARRLRGYQE